MESIELESYRIEVTEGEQVAIVATVMPEEARADNPVYYTSKNTAIATVDESGVVTGVAAGETKIDVQAGGIGVVCNVTVNAAKQIAFSDVATADVAFSTVTLSGKLNVSGISFQYGYASFYYMESDGNTSADEIKENGSKSTETKITIPDNETISETFTAKVSNLAVNTRYCCVSAVRLSVTGEFVFGEVQSFTTADLPAIPETVDMGFGPKWRGWNVGASNPSEGYPANFSDGKVDLESIDDAATQNLGSSWRMPTYQEMIALMNNVDLKWTRYKGVYGIVMTSKIEGYNVRPVAAE